MMTQIEFGKNKMDDYERVGESFLGKGAYGVVFKAYFKSNPQILVAIKHIQCQMQNEGFPSTSIRQISLLRQLNSPNIVKLLDVIIQQKKLYLVFEYLNKNLKQHIDELIAKKKAMEPKVMKRLLYQLIAGTAKMHAKRIVHRDLKPANILLDKDLNLKIADFGLARTYSIPTRPYSHDVVTLWYRAPEILLGAPQYSTPIDMWSIGCIFAEMIIQKPLFEGTSEVDQLKRIFRYLGTPNNSVWPGVEDFKGYKAELPSFEIKKIENQLDDFKIDLQGLDLLKSLLIYNPSKRITAKAALKHPYFNQIA